MNEKILVTGGAGHIGSVLVPQLLEEGYIVTVIDNFMYKQNSLLDVCGNKNLIVNGDIRNKKLLKDEVKIHDIIIPLAAIVGAPACDKDQALSTSVNFDQAKNICEWISDDQMVLFPVTNSGYGIGQKEKFCDEKSPLNPISHYGRTKVAAEKILLQTPSAITFRLATVFGIARECKWIY